MNALAPCLDWNSHFGISFGHDLWETLAALYISAKRLREDEKNVKLALENEKWTEAVQTMEKIAKARQDNFPSAPIRLPGRWSYWKAEALAYSGKVTQCKVEISQMNNYQMLSLKDRLWLEALISHGDRKPKQTYRYLERLALEGYAEPKIQKLFDKVKLNHTARSDTYYGLLCILPSASEQEIKTAYKYWALEYHPDKRKETSEKMAKVRFPTSI